LTPDLDTLIQQTAQSIEHDKGLSAMFATSAEEKQRLLSALVLAQKQLDETNRMYQEEHDARERAEAALAIERERPLNYNTYNVTLPSSEEAENLYPHKGKYTEVVEWLEGQQKKGVDFYKAAGMNRSKMCRQLSEIFKWDVNENSLRKAQEEFQKK
jgi:hypothetical protein